MKRVLVTGANGYIGSKVVNALLKKDAEVVAVDIQERYRNEQVEFIEGDLFDPLFDVLSMTGPIDVCLHLAWRNGFSHNDTSHIVDLPSHYLFLKDMIDKGVPQVATMGTMHEVGYWEGAVDEDTPCNPLSLYGIAKDALRRSLLLSIPQTSTKIQWLRAFYIIGDESRSQSIFGKLLRSAQQGNKKFPFTSGRNKYDFISVDELADQIVCCVLQDEIDGIINCCSGKPVSLAEEVEEFIKVHNLDISLEYGAFPDREYDSPAIWGDTTKIDGIMNNAQLSDPTC